MNEANGQGDQHDQRELERAQAEIVEAYREGFRTGCGCAVATGLLLAVIAAGVYALVF